MTKYKHIADLATKYAVAFMNQKAACEWLALKVRQSVRLFLEAPDDAVRFVALTDDLKTVWEPLDRPAMTQGLDGFWYFGLFIHFTTSASPTYTKIALKIGCRSTADHFFLKLDRLYEVERGDDDAWSPFLADLEAGLIADYSRNPLDPPRPIGFIDRA